MENIKLGGYFFCPRCQCTHSSAITCTEVQRRQKDMYDFFNSLRETTEEEKAMLTQPLFTLKAEEVEQLEMDILPDIIEEYKTHGRWYMERLEFCKNLLTRIKQWNENK